MADAGVLGGVGVLLARPGGRAASTGALIEKHGGRAIIFPALEIAPPGDSGALRAALNRLEAVDLMIFVSAHAVHSVGAQIKRHRLRIPDGTRVAAIGPKTAAQCELAAIKVDFVPRGRIDSEGLLEEMRGFDAAGKNILIFRGQSGRELIRRTLETRGARVRCVESYRRKVADRPVAPLLKRWRGNEIDLVVITSIAVMDALGELLGPRNRQLLNETPILTYSRRVAAYCREAGARTAPLVAEKPTDEAVVDAMIAWNAARVVAARARSDGGRG